MTRIDVFLVQTGVGVPWDGCKWNWQSNNKASISFTLPSPYQATLQFVGEGTSKVFYGPVELRNVKGMTIRYLPFFRIPDNDWVTDPCAITGHQNQGGLLKREMAFGFAPERGLRNFDSVSGNIDCKADGSYSLRGGTFGPQ
ncbi:hypothetical protein HYT01_03770 [Candidatus Giovannonibacteria bacterium]|nr:hypothetical protein [Candidatus Giovannonibacteria bacterium]